MCEILGLTFLHFLLGDVGTSYMLAVYQSYLCSWIAQLFGMGQKVSVSSNRKPISSLVRSLLLGLPLLLCCQVFPGQLYSTVFFDLLFSWKWSCLCLVLPCLALCPTSSRNFTLTPLRHSCWIGNTPGTESFWQAQQCHGYTTVLSAVLEFLPCYNIARLHLLLHLWFCTS